MDLRLVYVYDDPVFENAVIRIFSVDNSTQDMLVRKYGWDKIRRVDELNSSNDETHYVTVDGNSLVGVAEAGYVESVEQAKRKIFDFFDVFVGELECLE